MFEIEETGTEERMELPFTERRSNWTAAIIAAVYAVTAALWLIAASVLVRVLSPDHVFAHWIDDLKGAAFVVTTTGVLWFVLQQVFRSQAEARTRLMAKTAETQRLTQLAKNNPNPVIKLSSEGAVLFANPTAQELGGGERERLEKFLPAATANISRECIASGAPSLPAETEQDGRTWRWQFVPSVEGGPRVFAYGVERTAEVELERQLMQAARLEAAGRLAAGIAHDFGNLLTVISGYGELLVLDQEVVSRAEASAELRLALRRAKNLISEMMSVTRPRPTVERVFDLNEHLRALDPFLRHLLHRGVLLQIETCEAATPIEFDPQELEQVLLNLLANAVDAVNGDGLVVIRTSVEGRAAVTLSVEDSGSGIPSEHLSRIFEPFFSTKPEGQGTGLGLASVARIVSHAGASIDVRSELGHGSCFSVRLPLRQEPCPPPAATFEHAQVFEVCRN